MLQLAFTSLPNCLSSYVSALSSPGVYAPPSVLATRTYHAVSHAKKMAIDSSPTTFHCVFYFFSFFFQKSEASFPFPPNKFKTNVQMTEASPFASFIVFFCFFTFLFQKSEASLPTSSKPQMSKWLKLLHLHQNYLPTVF